MATPPHPSHTPRETTLNLSSETESVPSKPQSPSSGIRANRSFPPCLSRRDSVDLVNDHP